MASLRLRQLFAYNSSLIYAFLIIASCSSLCCLCIEQDSANEAPASPLDNATSSTVSASRRLPANHRGSTGDNESELEPLMGARGTKLSPSSARQGRQYDGTMSAAGTGNYGSLSGDGASYVSQVPLSAAGAGAYGAAAATSAASSYANELGAGFYHNAGPNYHDPLSMTRGYPSPPPPMHHHSMPGGYPGMTSLFGPQSMLGSGGLFSSSFPLMSKGFDLSEIVCTAIAVAIGAVIIGAPFILIYLFVMNQMNGNGPSAMGPSGGAISLTGPTSSTTVNGRKKRHTSLPEALFKQLSPLVNSEQVASTFKALMSSMAKYQM